MDRKYLYLSEENSKLHLTAKEASLKASWIMIPERLNQRHGDDVSKLGLGEEGIVFCSRIFILLMCYDERLPFSPSVPNHFIDIFNYLMFLTRRNWVDLLKASDQHMGKNCESKLIIINYLFMS